MLKGTLSLSLIAFASAALIATDVDAGRLGGGRSFGAQRNVAPAPTRPAAPQAPANASPAQPAPSNPDAASAPRAQTPPAAAPPASGSRWLAPLAGIAAGLGLAALLSHFGLSADFGGALLALLAVAAGVLVLRRVLARPALRGPPLQYAAAEPGRGPGSIVGPEAAVAMPPDHATVRIPADFDTTRFLARARVAFNQLQAAFDGGDRHALADMMTPETYAEVSRDLDARSNHRPTEVVKLDADVTEVVTEGDRYWASVRFSGLLREDGNPLANEFDEVWHLTKPVDGSHGWLVAGIQQMQEAVQ
jgi:predicted lipid-binding transport protein (Tim44 family)